MYTRFGLYIGGAWTAGSGGTAPVLSPVAASSSAVSVRVTIELDRIGISRWRVTFAISVDV